MGGRSERHTIYNRIVELKHARFHGFSSPMFGERDRDRERETERETDRGMGARKRDREGESGKRRKERRERLT